MEAIKVYLEVGKKKVFAGAVDWPGWCRSGRDEKAALQALIDYGQRYTMVLHGRGIKFMAPKDVPELLVSEQYQGNASTDFGAPAIIPDADRTPVDQGELERLQMILHACWMAFDFAVDCAMGVELRKGPRGGGRDLDQIIEHVLEADLAYLKRIAWKYVREGKQTLADELGPLRNAILEALDAAVNEGLPEQGPRGGKIWPVRYFVRRSAWHVLDHAWEIEDRSE